MASAPAILKIISVYSQRNFQILSLWRTSFRVDDYWLTHLKRVNRLEEVPIVCPDTPEVFGSCWRRSLVQMLIHITQLMVIWLTISRACVFVFWDFLQRSLVSVRLVYDDFGEDITSECAYVGSSECATSRGSFNYHFFVRFVMSRALAQHTARIKCTHIEHIQTDNEMSYNKQKQQNL